ncbi:helix-turn-helix transcriptional regulator [Nocardioides nematodiphilus]|uniref:helix-turn-helix transcriptional regulator n=1 Tax=Nocardioides nematodiphilus TaxID=2849669 RepID=UPI001CD94EB5|nr:WYL domain-containing protein [Nocardioides nematodiphilus]MCA1983766.1 WYL domain-containing protein [Nocardioides nematodiphilus]
MAAAKTERLMNLLIMLLVQRGYVGRDRIRELLYKDSSDEAFERMFERDKEELRSLGVPIETGSYDPLFEDEGGYRISPDAFALPAIELTADEAAVVGLATKVWEHARLADATTEAVRKLTAAGAEIDVAALDLVSPRLAAEEPSFDVFLEAVNHRIPVRFDYRTSGSPDAVARHLQPWGVVRFSGRWYVVGHDLDKDDQRVFRLSRVVGSARLDGTPGTYEIPEGVDVRAIAHATLRPDRPAEPATLLVRRGAGHMLRRHAAQIEQVDADWERLHLPTPPADLADEVLGHGADVIVESPATLRASVIARLQGVLA